MRDRFLMRMIVPSSCRYLGSVRHVLRTGVRPHGILKPKLVPSCHPRPHFGFRSLPLLAQQLKIALPAIPRAAHCAR
jgi:hypothetical protein